MTDTDRHYDGQDDRWVTVSHAALTVGVSERRIRRWIAAGRLATKDGDGARLVSRAAVRQMTVRPSVARPSTTVTLTDTMTVSDRHQSEADGQPSELTKAISHNLRSAGLKSSR